MSDQNDTADKLSGLSLNPNAGSFVPRVAAKPFVPSWMPPPAAAAPPAPAASSGIDFNRPPPAAVLNKTVETAAAPAPTPVAAPVAKPASPAPKAPAAEAPKKKVEAAPKPAAATPAPAPAPVEEEEVVDQETLTEFFGKEHMNVIFIGHVDAGKSTMGGRIL